MNDSTRERQLTDIYNSGKRIALLERSRVTLTQLPNLVNSKRLAFVPQPYHRSVDWDVTLQSRLIESLLINIPISDVVVCGDDRQQEIVDGTQRIKSIVNFYNNSFALTGLEVMTELEGLTYQELPMLIRDRLDRCWVHVISLLFDDGENSNKIEAFKQTTYERLNERRINIAENIDAAVDNFLDKLAAIDDYVRPEWELEIKQEIWDEFEIDTPSKQSIFESKLAEIRNPIRRKKRRL
jgi:Protein of unknown function DUF262